VTPEQTPDPRVPLVLVSGLAPGPNAEPAHGCVAEPGTAVVHHDLREIHSAAGCGPTSATS
jgi:hypothetical protein